MTPSGAGPSLPAALRACARGIYPLEAGVDLLISHAFWPHREDFQDQFIHTGISITDGVTTMAEIDWQAAISALDGRHLPCSGGEERMLRLAASLAWRNTREPPRHPDRHRPPQHRTTDHRDLARLGTTARTKDSLIIFLVRRRQAGRDVAGPADRVGHAAPLVRAAPADPGPARTTPGPPRTRLVRERTRCWQRLEKLLVRHEALLLSDGGERPSISLPS